MKPSLRLFFNAAVLGAGLLGSLAQSAVARADPPPARPGHYDSLGADWGAQQNEARRGVKQGRYIALAKVIDEINGRSPGYQLDAGLEEADGKPVYRVRWAAANGRRIDYIVDAVSGAILSAQ
jgi:uncharacterized membrane protein YkoI